MFPKRRRGSMGFGERKAHYLAIRPNARFATWIGRKKGAIEAKFVFENSKIAIFVFRPQVAPTAAQFTDHSATPEPSNKTDSVRPTKDKNANEATAQTAKVSFNLFMCNHLFRMKKLKKLQQQLQHRTKMIMTERRKKVGTELKILLLMVFLFGLFKLESKFS